MAEKLRQTFPVCSDLTDVRQALWETTEVAHIYVLDEYPGPSAHLFVSGRFTDWWPALTYERAVAYAERL